MVRSQATLSEFCKEIALESPWLFEKQGGGEENILISDHHMFTKVARNEPVSNKTSSNEKDALCEM
tara:strand:+ start:347 stop:544 length:198 start_codon:yes stop_codon:yes gene_type:complete